MLIAHATSTCDVCLEGYQEDCSYHSIPCGHVFCLPCLVSTSPPRCPLCRHEFTPYSVRKVHLTLPSTRDIAARKLELKLVQSSPEMTLAESLLLFQEVQEWLEGEAQEEFLVLRAFAAVLCGFHETKDKLQQTEARAHQNETLLLRSLDEARSATNTDGVEYKAKFEAAKSELAALRTECANLRAEAEQAQLRSTEIMAFYAQAQAQLHAKSQPEPEPKSSLRRISNPLPAPPRPIEIPFLKLIETSPASQLQANKGKAKDIAEIKGSDGDADPMSSVFVPTLSASITTKNPSGSDVRSEVTTLVFKPPKRVPVWHSPNTSYARLDGPSGAPPSAKSTSDSSSRPGSQAEANTRAEHSHTNDPQKAERSYAPSSLNPAWSEYAAHWNVPYVDGTGETNPAAGPVSRHAHPLSRALQSETADRHEYSPRSAAAQPVVSYASAPPHAMLHASWETQHSPRSRSMLHMASRPIDPRLAERKDLALGFSLRRASSPAAMLSDTDMMRTRSSDAPPAPFPPRADRGYGGGRMVPVLASTGDAVGEGSSDLRAGERHRQRHASPLPSEPRGLDSGGESRRPQVRNDHGGPSFAHDAMELPLRAVAHGVERARDSRGSPALHRHSHSLAIHSGHGTPRPPSPMPARSRAYSHSHSLPYPVLATPPNGRHTGDISPMHRRLTLDASSAEPDVVFHIIDQNGPRTVPVGKV